METDALTLQVVLSYAIVVLMQWMKRSALPVLSWISVGTPTVNRIVATTLAGVSALGIGYTFDAAAGTLVITGLTLASVCAFALAWARAWITQQVLYRTTQEPPAVVPVAPASRRRS